MKTLSLVLLFTVTATIANAGVDMTQVTPGKNGNVIGKVGWVRAEFGKDPVEVVIIHESVDGTETLYSPIFFTGNDRQAGLNYYTKIGKQVSINTDLKLISNLTK